MDFQQLVTDLTDVARLSLGEIAEETESTKTAISALKTGQNKNPVWPTGDKLIRLHAQHFPEEEAG